MVKTHVRGLHMRGFKSFNQRASFMLEPGLNAIVGPNGSGKSNVMDSICFVLGRMSTKSIRAEKIQDLIHNKKDKKVGSAEVSFRLDNTNKIFPLDSEHVQISRKITKEGKSKYYINGKRASRRQIVELLSIGRISPEGHNIILQGDIEKFISMSPNEKREIIEEIAGINVYEIKKKNAMRELSKVEEKLKEAKIVLKEKEIYLKGLEREKNQAEKYKSFNEELKRAKATELNLRTESINKKKKKIQSKLDKISKTKSKFQKSIEQCKKKISVLKQKISNIEEEIEKKGGDEQLEIEHHISELKLAVDNSENLILNSRNEINRVNQRKKQLEQNLKNITLKIKNKQQERDQLEKKEQKYQKEKKLLNSQASNSKQKLKQLEKDLNKKIEDIDNLKYIKQEIEKKESKLGSEAKLIEYKIEELNRKITNMKQKQEKIKKINKGKKIYKTLIQEINKISSKDSQFAVKLSDLNKKINKKRETIAKLNLNSKETRELLMRDRAVSQILRSKKKINGIMGTVAQLGNSDKKFQQALAVVAGSRMKNIVVNNENAGIKCLELLKRTKSGIATMLPMNKIKSRDYSNILKRVSRKNGVYGLAYNLISCDPKYKKIFKHIFRSTVVVEDIPTAKSIGVGNYQMVTLDGDIFSASGAITGGFRRRAGIKFSQKDMSDKLDTEKSDLSALNSELKNTEKERIKWQEELLKLRREKAELEGRIESADDSELDIEDTVKKQKELLSEQKKIISDKKEEEKRKEKTKAKIEKSIVEKNAISSKINKFKFGEKSTKINEIESKQKEIEAKKATVNAVLDNSLLPEKENIGKLLKHLNQEKKDFEEQINKEKENVKDNKTKLEKKKIQEKKFYGVLKKLFSKKKKYIEFKEKQEMYLEKIKKESTGDEEEENALSVAEAKMSAEFKAISEEFEEYSKLKPLKYIKDSKKAKEKQKTTKRKIDNLGSVNMRALEIYETVRKEHEKLTWRVDKLNKEQDSVVGVINKIEERKKYAFMESFSQVNKHFQRVFQKISDKMNSKLIIENEQRPFEGGIDIKVSDQNNKEMYIGSLSGGEKTLVALSFIFAIQEHCPAPFYLLDEIDAALDKVNSEKVAKLLKEYSNKSQVIVISHNDAIISKADNLYGIWMNKKGESFVNSLKI